ncbi:AMP-binding protein [Streptomyces sp. KL116D]|uniref:AMP-binding protein n=1 Tax=Streptomyces sp. KL116D TaxID=3045152 RepID=UPI003557C2D5
MTEHGCTVFMGGVPTMYFAARRGGRRRAGPTRSDRVFSRGSALPVKTLDDVSDTFGCPVYEGYGMTETSCSVGLPLPRLTFRPERSGADHRRHGRGTGLAGRTPTASSCCPSVRWAIVVRGPSVMARTPRPPGLSPPRC